MFQKRNFDLFPFPTTPSASLRHGTWLTRPYHRPQTKGTQYWASVQQSKPSCTVLLSMSSSSQCQRAQSFGSPHLQLEPTFLLLLISMLGFRLPSFKFNDHLDGNLVRQIVSSVTFIVKMNCLKLIRLSSEVPKLQRRKWV